MHQEISTGNHLGTLIFSRIYRRTGHESLHKMSPYYRINLKWTLGRSPRNILGETLGDETEGIGGASKGIPKLISQVNSQWTF